MSISKINLIYDLIFRYYIVFSGLLTRLYIIFLLHLYYGRCTDTWLAIMPDCQHFQLANEDT